MKTAPQRFIPNERRLHLVARRPAPPPDRSPLVLWHLLSLDAPTVAATWTAFAGWCAGVRLSAVDVAAMFVAVWMLYAADRLLDARPQKAATTLPELEERHRFHHRHRARFLPCMAAAALPLALLLHRTEPRVLHLYVVLAALLAAWLLLVHARQPTSEHGHRLPKEIAVGLFFPAAVFIPTVARAPALQSQLAPEAVLFAAVCTLNCLFLYAWEHPFDRTRAHPSTRWAVAHLRLLGAVTALLSAALALWRAGLAHVLPLPGAATLPHTAAIPAACSLSALLLLFLHHSRSRVRPVRLRALADLVLLTPVPVWVVLSVVKRLS